MNTDISTELLNEMAARNQAAMFLFMEKLHETSERLRGAREDLVAGITGAGQKAEKAFREQYNLFAHGLMFAIDPQGLDELLNTWRETRSKLDLIEARLVEIGRERGSSYTGDSAVLKYRKPARRTDYAAAAAETLNAGGETAKLVETLIPLHSKTVTTTDWKAVVTAAQVPATLLDRFTTIDPNPVITIAVKE